LRNASLLPFAMMAGSFPLDGWRKSVISRWWGSWQICLAGTPATTLGFGSPIPYCVLINF